jgi:high affinity Mn2+ porin
VFRDRHPIRSSLKRVQRVALALFAWALRAAAGPSGSPQPSVDAPADWNLHFQATGIVQNHPTFSAAYSGPNSMQPGAETKETLSFDVYAGAHLWRGAEAHVVGLVWQGFGLSNALGAEAFPNGESFRLGTNRPDAIVARAFLRQTFNFGAIDETVDDDAMTLRGKQSAERLTFTLGKFAAKDIFDNNRYANDPRTQFMNWALMANEGWDYPADSLGFETGAAAELNEPDWAVRAGVFQMPRFANAMPVDTHVREAWGSVLEIERRWTRGGHGGAARILVYRNHAHMGSYAAALDAGSPPDLVATRAYRFKTGVGLNIEQELTSAVGVFARLGWSDGRNESWCFSDTDRTASAGVSVKGASWRRDDDTLGFAGVVNGISRIHRAYFAAGGMGILAGDGALDYAPERALETYYDAQITPQLHAAVDYQLIVAPAFNAARGPISVFGARVHWEY